MNKLTTTAIGAQYESKALKHLLSQGLTLLHRNFRSKFGFATNYFELFEFKK